MTQTPQIRVDAIRKVFDDGMHNAFTDLCWFRGELYLTFRSCPDGHMVFPTSKIVVLRSPDGGEWRKVFEFSVPLRDVRDPHFLVFQNKLFVYSGAWLCNPCTPGVFDVNDHLGYAAWTADGAAWQGPRSMEGTYGHYVWRAAAFGGKAYLCARRVRDFTPTEKDAPFPAVRESALLESDDGLVWKWAGLFHDDGGDETAFVFEDDGAIVAVARTRANACLCQAKPPYRQWTRADLGRFIGGPLLARWGKRLLVGGRKRLADNQPRTVLSWLVDGRLEDVVELPSGGDTSYPGFAPFSDTRGLVSWYSSHEGSGATKPPCSIYLAELSLPAGA
ncbi:MAG TPA: hypothetical protein P5137_05360 [Candidatus Brocadiia bacterium]|nr:hypothetical protein [Candidatus Brocadiia bacterium]